MTEAQNGPKEPVATLTQSHRSRMRRTGAPSFCLRLLRYNPVIIGALWRSEVFLSCMEGTLVCPGGYTTSPSVHPSICLSFLLPFIQAASHHPPSV